LRLNFNRPRRRRRGEGKIDKTLGRYESEVISNEAEDYGLLSRTFCSRFRNAGLATIATSGV
jgi:hypothetical protein